MRDLKEFELRHIEEALELSRETDRGCVLVAAAMLDTRLDVAIRAKFIDAPSVVDELLKDNGPAASLSARIRLSFVLGLIDAEMTRALHLVRKVRNNAAHTDKRFVFDDHKDRIRTLAEIFNVPGDGLTVSQHFLGAIAVLLIGLDGLDESVERVAVTAHEPVVDRSTFVARHLPQVLRGRLQPPPATTPAALDFAKQVSARFKEPDEGEDND